MSLLHASILRQIYSRFFLSHVYNFVFFSLSLSLIPPLIYKGWTRELKEFWWENILKDRYKQEPLIKYRLFITDCQ